MNKKELWLRLKNYHFDHVVPANMWGRITTMFVGPDASAKAFASKIARKHKLKNAFAFKAVHEYKKYVYLGIVSDFNVTPSKIIDIIWHEHLLFSQAYRQFCDHVIEYTFDHHPELLPLKDQTGQFNAQYLDTLDLYRNEFGMEPPADIWDNTKYDKGNIINGKYRSGKKNAQNISGDSTNNYTNESALYTYFENHELTPEFGGFEAGDFGGGGASGSWDDATSTDAGDSGSGCSGGCGGGD